MRKSLIAVASLALCLGVVACEDENEADMGVMSGATATEDCGACVEKSACEDKAVKEASPGVVGDKSHCDDSSKTGDCPMSKGN